MKKSSIYLATLASLIAIIAFPISTEMAVAAVPNPVTCEGYPEPRVYLESQSWWEPQNGPPAPAEHPGTGKQGHIHVETCFPAYQTFGATGTIEFDLTVRMHNMPGVLRDIFIDTYGDYRVNVAPKLNRRCPTIDCAWTFHASVPLEKMRYSGLHAIMIEAYVLNELSPGGTRNYQISLPRWPLYLDNGMPLPPNPSIAFNTARNIERKGLIGDSLYNAAINGDYAQVAIMKDDLPFDPVTLQPRVKSGIWTPRVFFEMQKGFAYIDAALHAVPSSKGKVVYDGPGAKTDTRNFKPRGQFPIPIDTTELTNGVHKLLVGTCNTETQAFGDHCGTQVVRFTVNNVIPTLTSLSTPTLCALVPAVVH